MIDWGMILSYDEFLDSEVSPIYREQPLAQDWARVAKVAEEVGEAVQAYIGFTGQNPRKGEYANKDRVLDELADCFGTAILAIQHFTKDTIETERVLDRWFNKLRLYMGQNL